MTANAPCQPPRRHRRQLLAGLAALLVVSTGCAAQESDTVTRTGNRNLATQDEGFIGGKSLTRIPPEQRQTAPIAEGPALTGRGTVSTADYPGKVVVLNVWGSWCGPCRAEAADLAEASRRTTRIAAFVGLNIRDAEPAAPRAFVRAFDIPYPHIFDPNGAQLVRFAGTLPPNGIPTTLIIDKQGRIAARMVGVVSRDSLIAIIGETEQGR